MALQDNIANRNAQRSFRLRCLTRVSGIVLVGPYPTGHESGQVTQARRVTESGVDESVFCYCNAFAARPVRTLCNLSVRF